MKTGAAYLAASAQIDCELRALLADTPAQPSFNERFLEQHEAIFAGTHHPFSIHDLVEMGHFVLSGVAPYPLVAEGRCRPANDDHLILNKVSLSSTETKANANQSFNILEYLPGPLRQSVIQLLVSIANVAIPELRVRSVVEKNRPQSLSESFGRMQRALRANANQIAQDVSTAGLGDIIVEIVGYFTREIDVICKRILRALRHSMLPILQAMRHLIIPDPNIPYRDSVDSAVRLFVQAGIVGGCVVIEQYIETMMHKIFPIPYIGIIISCFMAFVCIISIKKAMHLLDKIDIAGAGHYRQLINQVEVLRQQGTRFDQRLKSLIMPVRG